MDRDEILDKIEDIQETVDNMNFQGSQEAELWLREGVADYVLELVNNLSQHLVSDSVCLHESQYQSYNSKTRIQTCDNCGEITN